jgi:hypothetical protein
MIEILMFGNGSSDELAEALLYGSTVGMSSFQAIGSAKVLETEASR